MEDVMFKKLLTSAAVVAFLSLPSAAADYGTAEEAKVMLDRVVEAVKADKAAALAKFNKGEDNFWDRDLYPFCNGPDGIISAHPSLLGKNIHDIKDVDGFPVGEEIVKAGEEGKVKEVSYKWPRPGTTEPVAKVAFVTKVDDQVCGVGYYK
jgi:signal transduction histidine kinase